MFKKRVNIDDLGYLKAIPMLPLSLKWINLIFLMT